ncbi:phosphotransferase family protein [Mycobacterium sp. ACS4331]|uniref:phosphotransferase family protein n=1 Tax=Mycobacterium sp. ACS4331 TaxID=1834121 RepID=UPI000800FB4B|nr:phosphotransferase family protein [Mycobacterium sp. ACS4331]OBF25439.1 acyl-CoA dehydrogenase [Mycobacterium sp. ACS4331]
MPTAPLAADQLPAALEPIVRRRIAGAARAEIVDWRVPVAGHSNETFLFDLVGVDGPQPTLGLVFRRPPEHPMLPEFDLRRQYLVMQRLASSPIPVPAVRWLETSTDELGTPYYVMDRVDGVLGLTDMPAYHCSGPFADADEAGRAAMWNGCVDVIADIHAIDPDEYGLGFLQPDRLGGPSVADMVGYLRSGLDWARGDRPLHPSLVRGLDWLEAHPHNPVSWVLCWGDSRMSNLLYRPDHTVATVLDWEIAHVGDPAADLAWMLMTDWMLSPLDDNAPAAGTPTREETLDRYRERTGNDLTNLTFYEVAAPLTLAIGMLRLSTRWGLPDTDLSGICARRIEKILDGD